MERVPARYLVVDAPMIAVTFARNADSHAPKIRMNGVAMGVTAAIRVEDDSIVVTALASVELSFVRRHVTRSEDWHGSHKPGSTVRV